MLSVCQRQDARCSELYLYPSLSACLRYPYIHSVVRNRSCRILRCVVRARIAARSGVGHLNRRGSVLHGYRGVCVLARLCDNGRRLLCRAGSARAVAVHSGHLAHARRIDKVHRIVLAVQIAVQAPGLGHAAAKGIFLREAVHFRRVESRAEVKINCLFLRGRGKRLFVLLLVLTYLFSFV